MAKQFLDATGLLHLWNKIKTVFQEKLVSGTNIKSINGISILGEGNININTDNYLPLSGGTITGTLYIKTQLQFIDDDFNANVIITAGQYNNGIIVKDSHGQADILSHQIICRLDDAGSDAYIAIADGNILQNYLGVYDGALSHGIVITNSGGGQGLLLGSNGLTLYTNLGIKSATSTKYDGDTNEMWNTAGGKTTIEALTENEINAILV